VPFLCPFSVMVSILNCSVVDSTGPDLVRAWLRLSASACQTRQQINHNLAKLKSPPPRDIAYRIQPRSHPPSPTFFRSIGSSLGLPLSRLGHATRHFPDRFAPGSFPRSSSSPTSRSAHRNKAPHLELPLHDSSRRSAAPVPLRRPRRRRRSFSMDDFVSETDSEYTSYWRDWVG
jgi:hypothetical protein